MRYSLLPLLVPALFTLACDGANGGFIDADGDGYYANTTKLDELDCDDNDPRVHPNAPEVCDGVDNNCNGQVDEASAKDAVQFWPDRDGDGFGVRRGQAVYACEAPKGYAANRGDCDDKDDQIYPGAPERCNDIDDNCDGNIDEGLTVGTWYADADADGYGGALAATGSCRRNPAWVQDASDCNDANPAVNPAATEVCDGIDNNCNGKIDDADPGLVGGSTFYADQDRDGFGNPLKPVTACATAAGRVDNADDCDDNNAALHPNTVWYRDADADGHGDPDETSAIHQCDPLIGYAIKADDCDDTDPLAWTGKRWYTDADADGYGSTTLAGTGCGYQPAWSGTNDDCNDADPLIHPGAAEVCDGIDNNCDGLVDDDDEHVTGTSLWYLDSDGDGLGALHTSISACAPQEGYVANADDCNDTDPNVLGSGAWYKDADRDGFGDPDQRCGDGCVAVAGCVQNAEDCDDTRYRIHPNTRWFADLDEDGVGDLHSLIATSCTPPATPSTSLAPGDCDDLDPTIDDASCLQLVRVELVVDVPADLYTGQLYLNCDQLGMVFSRPLGSRTAGTSLLFSTDLPALSDACAIQVSAGDTTLPLATLFLCDAEILTTDASGTATFTLDPSDACSACTDPSAINADTSALISTPEACVYP